MMKTEYCITLLLEGAIFTSCLTEPRAVDTVWGPAVRAEMVGKLLWGSDLYVSIDPCDRNYAGFLKRLPTRPRGISYTGVYVHADCPYFDRVDAVPILDRNAELPHPSQLALMLAAMCEDSPTWAIFVLHHCDDMVKSFVLDIPSASDLLDRFIYEEPAELEGGFSIVSL